METKTLTAGLSVSEQIVAADLQAIKDAGFRAITCNRPNGEGADQPKFEEIAKAATKVGMEAAYLPIAAGKVCDDDAAAFDKALIPGRAVHRLWFLPTDGGARQDCLGGISLWHDDDAQLSQSVH